MKVLIVLSAVLVSVLGMPSGTYYRMPAPVHHLPAPVHHLPAPIHHLHAPAHALSYSRPLGPIVTGTMHASQDTAGQYTYGYTSSDGQSKTESKPAGGDVTGEFSYTSPEGENVNLQYTAGEGGFVAAGSHVPVPQEMPADLAAAHAEAIATLNKAHEEARLRGDIEPIDGRYDDGSYRPEHHEASLSQAHLSYHHMRPVHVPLPAKSTYGVVRQPVDIAAPLAPVAIAAPSGPAIYSSSSFQTELGGPAALPVPMAPSVYAVPPSLPTLTRPGKSGHLIGY